MAHTPLLWHNNGGQIEGPGDYLDIVAHVGRVNYQSNQDTANARLIVAAVNAHEDLLEVLRLYVMLDNDRRAKCEIIPADWAECHQTAEAAIAKAKRI